MYVIILDLTQTQQDRAEARIKFGKEGFRSLLKDAGVWGF